MSDLLQQAIADAKAIKKIAIENAKATLAETFEPQIKSMIQERLLEEGDDLYEYMEEEEETELEESDLNLDSIIEELRSELQEEQYEDPHEVLLEELENELLKENEQLLEDINVLEGIRDELYEELEEEEEEVMEGTYGEEDEELELEHFSTYGQNQRSLFEEKDEEDEEVEMEDEEMEISMEENPEDMSKKELVSFVHQLQAQLDQLQDQFQGGEEIEETEDEMPTEEEVKEAVEAVLNSMHPREVRALEEAVLGPVKPLRKVNESFRSKKSVVPSNNNNKEVDNLRKKLRESYRTVNDLQSTLNEVSLINSKLLYTGKLFRTYNNLSEQNKIAILEFFDKVNTLEEVKHLYGKFSKALGKKTSSLTENTSNRVASPSQNSRKANTRLLSESTASKSAGVSTKPTRILEEDMMIARFQELAGIIKK